MAKVRVGVTGYGYVTVPLPPKSFRKEKQVLADMITYAVSETWSLMEEKTVKDFRVAIELLGPNIADHKHIYKLTPNQLEYHATWVCDCGSTQCIERDDLYPILKGENNGPVPGARL